MNIAKITLLDASNGEAKIKVESLVGNAHTWDFTLQLNESLTVDVPVSLEQSPDHDDGYQPGGWRQDGERDELKAQDTASP